MHYAPPLRHLTRVNTSFLNLQLLLMNREIDVRELDFLLRFNIDHSYVSPVEFLSNSAWSAIRVRKYLLGSITSLHVDFFVI